MKLISLTTFIVLNFILGQTGILNNKQNYISIAVVSKITQDTYNKPQLIGEWSFLYKDNDTKTTIENLTEGKIKNTTIREFKK